MGDSFFLRYSTDDEVEQPGGRHLMLNHTVSITTTIREAEALATCIIEPARSGLLNANPVVFRPECHFHFVEACQPTMRSE